MESKNNYSIKLNFRIKSLKDDIPDLLSQQDFFIFRSMNEEQNSKKLNFELTRNSNQAYIYNSDEITFPILKKKITESKNKLINKYFSVIKEVVENIELLSIEKIEAFPSNEIDVEHKTIEESNEELKNILQEKKELLDFWEDNQNELFKKIKAFNKSDKKEFLTFIKMQKDSKIKSKKELEDLLLILEKLKNENK